MSKIENSTILEVSEMLQNVLKQDSKEKTIDNERRYSYYRDYLS